MADSPRIAPARLRWHDDQPFSDTYGDIYHAPDGAAEVARVFLAPSRFAERLSGAARFRIGELGFGSGLNFVVAAQACLAAGSALHFVSFEAAPFAPTDFAQVAARRSVALPLYAELARAYPPLVRGWHQRHLADGRIRLTVYWGDANDGIAELAAAQRLPVDAWFLDGFAPDRNPELWNDTLFARIAGLCAAGTTIATFTAAGRVRRSLQQAGFAMRRVDQRPHKRESLAGTFVSPGGPAAAGFQPPREAIVIGAGLAGASAARHLAEAGVRVTVHDPQPPGGPFPGHPADSAAEPAARQVLPGSAVPTTVLHGRLLADTGTAGTLRCHAFLYAAAWAARFAGFEATGVLQLPAAESAPPTPAGSADQSTAGAARLAAIAAAWGDTGPWLELVGHAAAAARTGWPVASGGLWFPTGGIVDTPRLCAALLRHPDIEVVAAACALPAAPPADDRPVVLACGMATLAAAPAHYLELAPVHGQLDFVATAAPPRAPIVGNGYLAPGGGLLAAGATYEYRPWDPDEATRANLRQLAGHAFRMAPSCPRHPHHDLRPGGDRRAAVRRRGPFARAALRQHRARLDGQRQQPFRRRADRRTDHRRCAADGARTGRRAVTAALSGAPAPARIPPRRRRLTDVHCPRGCVRCGTRGRS
jgi:tRNA 5-methylaminomethyl-2-thiouridine biosynthesis bifunctional protein